MAAAWEVRRGAYARGWLRTHRVPGHVVSIGNLTVGGTGKTTLTLHLAAQARARSVDVAVICRRYRPGPQGEGDEALLYRAALGSDTVYAGVRKLDLARAAAGAGHRLLLVDDGFSHWPLERDLDIVLLDAGNLLGGGRLLPAGRLREPLRALQRAGAVVVSRLAPDQDPGPLIDSVRHLAPAAVFAAGRHRVDQLRGLNGGGEPAGPVWVLTATGNPQAVERSAAEAGCEIRGRTTARDHHWFEASEIERASSDARRHGARLLVTAKDAVRWPPAATRAGVLVLDVAWQWVRGGEAVERLVFEEASA